MHVERFLALLESFVAGLSHINYHSHSYMGPLSEISLIMGSREKKGAQESWRFKSKSGGVLGHPERRCECAKEETGARGEFMEWSVEPRAQPSSWVVCRAGHAWA